jgi:hypothetical protein
MSGWTSFRNGVTNVAKKVAPVALGAAGAYFGGPLLGSLAGSLGGSLFGGGGGNMNSGQDMEGYDQPMSPTGGGSNYLSQIMGGAGRLLGGAAGQQGYGGGSNMLSTLLGGGAQLYGQNQAVGAINRAADISAQTAKDNLAFNRDVFNQAQANQQPFLDAGKVALGKLSPLMDYKKFSMDDFHADPGYNFRLTQGQQAIDRSAAAGAGLQSGAALKAAAEFGQKMGSDEYNNAFNRYGIEHDRAINPLMQVAGFGGTTANNMASGAQNYANTGTEIMQNAGTNQGNAALARGSTYANSGNQLAQTIARYRMG